MTPYEYMLKTRETAIYPRDVALPYLVLGLVGEIGELKEAIRNGNGVSKEAGDVLWYAFRLTDEVYGDKLTDNDISKQWRVFETGIYGYDDLPIEGMYAQASIVAEIIKKAVRDSGRTVPESKIIMLSECLNKIVYYVSRIAKQENANIGSTHSLEQYAIANIEKLQSRKSRNVIGGSGDER